MPRQPIGVGFPSSMQRGQAVTNVANADRQERNLYRRAFRDSSRKARKSGNPDDSLKALSIFDTARGRGVQVTGTPSADQTNNNARQKLSDWFQDNHKARADSQNTAAGQEGGQQPITNNGSQANAPYQPPRLANGAPVGGFDSDRGNRRPGIYDEGIRQVKVDGRFVDETDNPNAGLFARLDDDWYKGAANQNSVAPETAQQPDTGSSLFDNSIAPASAGNTSANNGGPRSSVVAASGGASLPTSTATFDRPTNSPFTQGNSLDLEQRGESTLPFTNTLSALGVGQGAQGSILSGLEKFGQAATRADNFVKSVPGEVADGAMGALQHQAGGALASLQFQADAATSMAGGVRDTLTGTGRSIRDKASEVGSAFALDRNRGAGLQAARNAETSQLATDAGGEQAQAMVADARRQRGLELVGAVERGEIDPASLDDEEFEDFEAARKQILSQNKSKKPSLANQVRSLLDSPL